MDNNETIEDRIAELTKKSEAAELDGDYRSKHHFDFRIALLSERLEDI